MIEAQRENLSINNIVLIDKLNIQLSNGLCVLLVSSPYNLKD